MGAREKTDDDQDDRSSDLEKEDKPSMEGESGFRVTRDSASSQGDTPNSNDNKVKRATGVPKKPNHKQLTENSTRSSRVSSDRKDSSKPQIKPSSNGQIKPLKTKRMAPTPKFINDKKFDSMSIASKPPSEISEGSDDKTIEDVKEVDGFDEVSNCDLSVGSDDAGENLHNVGNACGQLDEMTSKIEKLEEELREVAALEISLYSVAAEHGSSAHKVHTPSRRISRLYIHACKHWPPEKRATVARSSASGIVLVVKSCGNDVSRLTFWLSNTVVLREIISQSFGSSSNKNVDSGVCEANDGINKFEGKSSLVVQKNTVAFKQPKGLGFMRQINDWQEASTFLSALERIESWIFSKLVESIWWQIFNSYMHSSEDDIYVTRSCRRLLGPALGDQQQGTFSINLWKSAFHDAFLRLCPVRAGRNECGCLPVLARMVMKHCMARLDVAMFNAILRESAIDIPTDPLSDPIVDVKVLPVPAGNLSFGSGAQLKNAIGNWSRLLTDLFGMDVEDSIVIDEDKHGSGGGVGDAESRTFPLLSQMSDLLMLPKDMLLDGGIRKEVFPSIGLSIVTRILCNFTPDEFCLDHVPGNILEELNLEAELERRCLEMDPINSFPRPAPPVVYAPPSKANVAEKVVDAGTRTAGDLGRRASMVQRKGYTSDEDLEDLDSPLESMDKTPPASSPSGSGAPKNALSSPMNARFMLLREVWWSE